MSPADELRAAAKRIREAAGNAAVDDPGPWRHDRDEGMVLSTGRCVVDVATNAAGDHIALFDPIVAEAVAAWLESEADDAEHTAATSIYGPNVLNFIYEEGETHPALALARAINAAPSTSEAQPS